MKPRFSSKALNHVIVELGKRRTSLWHGLVYAKIESDAARLALWLHIVNAVVKGEEPSPVISGETMQAAIELAAFYLWQHKLIHAHNAPTRKTRGHFPQDSDLSLKSCGLKAKPSQLLLPSPGSTPLNPGSRTKFATRFSVFGG
jgi:hypothetical protein